MDLTGHHMTVDTGIVETPIPNQQLSLATGHKMQERGSVNVSLRLTALPMKPRNVDVNCLPHDVRTGRFSILDSIPGPRGSAFLLVPFSRPRGSAGDALPRGLCPPSL